MQWLYQYLILPRDISTFERAYLGRINRVALWFLYAHLPVFIGVAAIAGTSLTQAAVLTSIALVGPTLVYFTVDNPRAMSITTGFTAMVLGGLLVHLGQGPMQIEMHFYFFVLLALLAVFANPAPILVAAVTVVIHHVTLWLLVPASVFNYEASIWTVVVHGTFVVLESVAAIFVARSFFDSVIRLERNVISRTAALDAQTRELRLVLDNVGQGFLTVAADGTMARERSAILTAWLGEAPVSQNLFDYLEPLDSDVAGRMMIGWFDLQAHRLPVEGTLAQLPRRLLARGRELTFDYRSIGSDRVLVVVSDITLELERDRAELASRELVAVLDRLGNDRAGLTEFYDEGGELVRMLASPGCLTLSDAQRQIHTLKGNAAIFGVESVAAFCHVIETRMAADGKSPTAAECLQLCERWRAFTQRLDAVLGTRAERRIELTEDDLESLLVALRRGAPRAEVIALVEDWKLEPVGYRFQRIAAQASRLAHRLGKDLRVEIHDPGIRLERARWAPFWAAFVHAVRNAVDHGFEDGPERASAGKPAAGAMELSADIDNGQLTIELRDDGRGVNWEKLRSRARSLGLPHDTHDQLVDAMLANGVSTRDAVSEVSGRGVGLAALREAVLAGGGEIRIDSRPMRGTTFRFSFPCPDLIRPTALVARAD